MLVDKYLKKISPEHFIIYSSTIMRGLGQGSLGPILPLYLKSLGFNIQNYSTIILFGSLASMIFESFWGVLSDKVGQEKIIFMIFTFLSFLTISYTLSKNFFLIILINFIWHLFSIALSPCFKAMVANVSIFGKTGTSLGVYITTLAFGRIIGTLINSYIAEYFGYNYALYFTSSIFFLAGIIITRSEQFKGFNILQLKTLLSSFNLSSFEYSKTIFNNNYFSKTFRSIYILTVFHHVAMAMVRRYLPLIASDMFNASIIQVGYLLMIMQVVEGFSTPISGFLSDKLGRISMISLGFVIYGSIGLSSLYIKNLNHLMFVVGCMALGRAVVDPSLMALLTDLVDKKSWGAIQGIHGTFQDLGGLLSPIISGGAWVMFGPMSIFIIAGVLQITNLGNTLYLKKFIKKS
jgi:MFS family permease